jgi:hypothetical protein
MCDEATVSPVQLLVRGCPTSGYIIVLTGFAARSSAVVVKVVAAAVEPLA